MNTEIDPQTNELVAVEGYAGSEYQKIGYSGVTSYTFSEQAWETFRYMELPSS